MEPPSLCWLPHCPSEYCQTDISRWMTTCLPPLQCSIDELQLDTHCLFDLVLSDPEFEGLFPNLSQSAAVQAVAEAMRVLHSAPAPQVQKTIDMSGIMYTSAIHIPSQCVGNHWYQSVHDNYSTFHVVRYDLLSQYPHP